MRTLILALLLVAVPAGAAPRVVASIAPIGAIVADVMAGVAAPAVLVTAAQSPHDYSLRPSAARALSEADVVFWIGPGLEAFLSRPLASLAANATVVDFSTDPSLRHLPWREESGHDAHGHPEHGTDPHVWLSTANAAAIALRVAHVLATADPENAEAYQDNATASAAGYRALGRDARQRLEPLAGKGYVSFHDGFQYFDREMSIRFDGSILATSGVARGVDGVRALREGIGSQRPGCLLLEPQYPERLARTLVEDTGLDVVVADPIGIRLEIKPGAYAELIRGLVEAFETCLRDSGR